MKPSSTKEQINHLNNIHKTNKSPKKLLCNVQARHHQKSDLPDSVDLSINKVGKCNVVNSGWDL